MSNSIINNLTRERLQQLYNAAGGRAQQQEEQPETTAYNWRQSHYFNKEQLNNISEFTEILSALISEKFTELCHGNFTAAITSVSQHFASELSEPFIDSSNYCLPFGTAVKQLSGFIGIPQPTALAWAKQLLGDNENEENPDRELSHLEESLLGDLASAITTLLDRSHPSWSINSNGNVSKGQWPLDSLQTDELLKISFDIKKADSQTATDAYIIFYSSRLDEIAGKKGQGEQELSDADSYKLIFEHISNLSVDVTAQLDTAEVGFEDILNLQTGDIILLEKPVQEPVTLLTENRILGFGRLGKCDSRYAVTVTTIEFPKTTQNNAPAAEAQLPRKKNDKHSTSSK